MLTINSITVYCLFIVPPVENVIKNVLQRAGVEVRQQLELKCVSGQRTVLQSALFQMISVDQIKATMLNSR